MVQSFPSPTSTITMLQARPSSSEAFQNGSQNQQHQRNHQTPRTIYNTSMGTMVTGNYRGQTLTSPITPYGFQNLPIPQDDPNPLRQHPIAPQNPRLESRTASAPSIPITSQASQQNPSTSNRPRPLQVSTGSSVNTPPPQLPMSKDGGSISPGLNSKQSNSRPFTALDLNTPSLQPASYATVAKSSPDRYRRNHRRAETSGPTPLSSSIQHGSAMPSGSGMATVGHLYTHPLQSNSTPSLTTYRGTQTPSSPIIKHDSYITPHPGLASKDDMNLQRERQAQSEQAKRYRRRSISSLEAKDYALSEAPAQKPAPPKTYAAMLAGPAPGPQASPQDRQEARAVPANERPSSAHGRNGSNESSQSHRSAQKPASVGLPLLIRISDLILLMVLTSNLQNQRFDCKANVSI